MGLEPAASVLAAVAHVATIRAVDRFEVVVRRAGLAPRQRTVAFDDGTVLQRVARCRLPVKLEIEPRLGVPDAQGFADELLSGAVPDELRLLPPLARGLSQCERLPEHQ